MCFARGPALLCMYGVLMVRLTTSCTFLPRGFESSLEHTDWDMRESWAVRKISNVLTTSTKLEDSVSRFMTPVRLGWRLISLLRSPGG